MFNNGERNIVKNKSIVDKDKTRRESRGHGPGGEGCWGGGQVVGESTCLGHIHVSPTLPIHNYSILIPSSMYIFHTV